MRVLLTYGDRPWNDQHSITDYIFEDEMDEEMFKNRKVAEILKIYKERYQEGQRPTVSDFAYDSDHEIVKLVIESTNHP